MDESYSNSLFSLTASVAKNLILAHAGDGTCQLELQPSVSVPMGTCSLYGETGGHRCQGPSAYQSPNQPPTDACTPLKQRVIMPQEDLIDCPPHHQSFLHSPPLCRTAMVPQTTCKSVWGVIVWNTARRQ